MDNKNHPVYDVYDLQRTVSLNIKYYGLRLRRVERQNFWIEVLLAITAPSSAIAGMWFTNSPEGQTTWEVLTAVAAILAVIKPFLKLQSRIKRYEQVLSGYRTIFSDIEELVHQIRVDKEYSKASKKIFDSALKKKRALLQSSPESTSDKALAEQCMNEVNREIPVETLYIPEK